MAKTCAFEGCGRKYRAKGLCEQHYRQYRTTGSTWKLRPTDEERFWEKVDRSGGYGACWDWLGRLNENGYGGCQYRGEWRLAHRVSYEISSGIAPEGLCVCHHCDRPRCVNPSHLFLGTHTDNMRDMFAKGRRPAAVGEAHGNSVLTEAAVREIRRLHAAGTRQCDIAASLGLPDSTVNNVVSRRAWRHVA